METFILGLILLVLMFLSGFFSASETALFSLPSTKINAYKSSPSPRRRLIASLVMDPRALLVTVFMLNTLVNILVQNTTSSLFGEDASWDLKVGVPFILLLIFGEIIPKHLGLQNNVKLADIVAPITYKIQKWLTPIRVFIVKITVPISRVMFFFLKSEDSISKDELKHALKTSQKYGVLNQDEAELVFGYINLQDATAKELMWPKEDILFYDVNEPISKLIHLFVDKECSRLPVRDKTIDNLLGIIPAPHFFLNRHQIKVGKDLIPYLEKPLFVPETTSAKALARQLDTTWNVMAIIVDEYGLITGLLTREDIVEEVVGDIVDRRDIKPTFTISTNHDLIASGKMEIAEFNKHFNTHLQSENNMITIGGWLTEQLQQIPKSGSTYNLQGFSFKILAADQNKIRRLYIQRIKK